MTPDTQRALVAIKPIADVLRLRVSADDKFLYINGQAVGIVHNSTHATVMEFIGYCMIQYDETFRSLALKADQISQIQRYWFTQEQISIIRIMVAEA